MRPDLGVLRRGSLRVICGTLIVSAVLSWSLAQAQQSFAPIYRAGVSDAPVASSASNPAASRRFLFVVAGDVRAPGVFYTDRATVTAGELIERAGGSSTLYEPMVHRVSGVRVVETLCLRDASNWQLAEGELLRVVGPRGVHDARVEPLTTSSGTHVICLGLSPYPVLIELPEGRTTLNDLLDLTGQSPDLAGAILVLPVRVYPREAPAGLEPGTLVIFPSDKVQLNSVPAGLIPPPAPLEPEPAATSTEQVRVPDSAFEAHVPVPADSTAPALLPARSTSIDSTPESSPSPLFVPATSAGAAAASLPIGNYQTPIRETSLSQTGSSPDAHTHEITLSHSVVPADVTSAAASVQSSTAVNEVVDAARQPVRSPQSGNNLSQVVLYTAGLAVICLALAGVWTYLDRIRSIATAKSFAEQSTAAADAQVKLASRQVSHVQALIDNKVPIIEETVEAPRSQHFFGEAWGQRRLRLDTTQPLAGPHVAFRPQTAQVRDAQRASAIEEPAKQESDSRQLQRVLAVLSAEQSRLSRRRVATADAEAVPKESDQLAMEQRSTRESSLERALRQVMRKDRS